MNKVTAKREKRKNEILRAASEVFAKLGYEKATMKDIAEELNIGRTTLYEYFLNKEQILSAYLENEMNVFYQKTMSAMQAEGPLKNKMRNILIVCVQYANQHRGFSQLYVALSGNNSEAARKTKKTLFGLHHQLYQAFAKELKDAISRGEIREISPELFVNMFFNITSSPIRLEKNLINTADQILKYFWEGISLEKGR